MTDTPHALLAPSAAARWVNCALSPTLERAHPEPESEAAREGTAAHWVLSERLLGRRIPNVGTVAPNGAVVTEEMIEGSDTFVHDLAALGLDMKAPVLVETRVDIPAIHPDCWGTLDAAHVVEREKRIYLWDYKFGHGYVEAWGNWQLAAYLLGLIDYWDADETWTFRAAIVQPRWYGREGPVRVWEPTWVTLQEMRGKLVDMAANVSLDGLRARAHTGPHCWDCTGAHACGAFQRAAARAVDLSLRGLSGVVEPAQMAAELAVLHAAADRLEARKAALDAQATALIKRGVSVPGWALAPGQSREKWTADAETVIALGAALGVPLAKPVEPITPNQARKAGLAPEVVAEYSERPPGAMKLVPVDERAVAKRFSQ